MATEAYNEKVSSETSTTDKPIIRRHPSIDTLPLERQQELYRREEIIKALLAMRQKYGQIPRGERRAAAAELKKGWRMIHEYMQNYVDYAEAYPDEPPVNVFVPLQVGRPEGSGSILTDDQKSVIKYAILERSRVTIYATGRVDKVPDYDFEVFDVYRFVKTICPEVGSYDTVRRYANRFRVDKAALCKMFIESREAAERDLILKRRNDVMRPNQRWQCDVRYLPFYIIHDGQICPVALIIIYDDFSRYIVAWKLIPMVKREKNGHLRKRGVTARDIAELLAFAMLLTGVRPDEFYTDNGPEFIGLEPYLPRLADDPPIRFVHSRPRMPWGRGKIENGLGQVTQLLRRLSTGYRPNKDRPSINLAQKTAKLTIIDLEKEFEEHFKEVLTYKPKTRPSRITLWTGAKSHPAPPIRKLAHLNIPSQQVNVTVDQWCINTLSDQWEPKITGVKHVDTDIYKRWADAVQTKEENVLWGIQLYGKWYAEVCLRDVWVVLEPKQPQLGDDHIKAQQRSLADLNNEGRLLIEEGAKTINRLRGGLPGRKTSTGEYLPAAETEQAKRKHAEAEASKKQKQSQPRAAKSSAPEPVDGQVDSQPCVKGRRLFGKRSNKSPLCERPPPFWQTQQQKSLRACLRTWWFGIIVVLAQHDAGKVLCP